MDDDMGEREKRVTTGSGRSAKKRGAKKTTSKSPSPKKNTSSGSPKKKTASKKKSASPKDGEEKEKRKKRKERSYKTYIYKTLKGDKKNNIAGVMNSKRGISGKAMSALNTIVFETERMIASEVHNIKTQKGTKTVSVQDIKTSVRLNFPSELSKHAVAEATKAVTKLTAAREKTSSPSQKTNKPRAKPVSNSVRAGLVFPIGRVQGRLRKVHGFKRVSLKASAYLAAVLEYIIAEISEVVENGAKSGSTNRVRSSEILRAINNDDDLRKVFPGVVVGGGYKSKQFVPVEVINSVGSKTQEDKKIYNDFVNGKDVAAYIKAKKDAAKKKSTKKPAAKRQRT
jgi:histone H3/H4